MPRLGRSVIEVSTSPAQTPVALTTAPARTVSSCPVRVSTSRAEVPVTDSARTLVSTLAPYCAAVRARATTSRASSTSWPSCATSAPRRPAVRTPGTSCRVRAASIRRIRGSNAPGVPALTRSASPAWKPARISAPCPGRSRSGSSGTSWGSARIRCGAVRVISTPRSTALSRATLTRPEAR